jgi:hypothetical protein
MTGPEWVPSRAWSARKFQAASPAVNQHLVAIGPSTRGLDSRAAGCAATAPNRGYSTTPPSPGIAGRNALEITEIQINLLILNDFFMPYF